MTTTLDFNRPKTLLAQCPVHMPTPLRQVTLGGQTLWIKDETDRMGLGAFKALGGVYAVASLLKTALGAEDLMDPAVISRASGITFVCASAGNHGMAVAAGARLFGAKCRIHLSAAVPKGFESRLSEMGAEVVRSGEDYEQSVAAAIDDAAHTGSVHLADGSWPGYTEPPRLVMEGYTVMAEEMRSAFSAQNMWPSIVYLQAGVGGLAAAIAYMIRKNWLVQPEIVVVEPDTAPCLKQSVISNAVTTVAGPVSNMGRLDCKTPSLLAFDILKTCANRFVTVSDLQADDAVKYAAKWGVNTTPSGAAGLAAMLNDDLSENDSLIILSEGVTSLI